MKSIEWYKETFGGGEAIEYVRGRAISVPAWLAHFLLDRCGLRSKKKRIAKKVLKKEVQQMLEGLLAEKKLAEVSNFSTDSSSIE